MNVEHIKNQFPIFSRRIHGHPLTYLDSAATAQRPRAVIAAMDDFYRRHNANPRRGLYQLSLEATEMVEQARKTVAAFVGAKDPREIIFTSGATAAINLVASTWADAHLRPGDQIILSELEHHSNLVPWQQLAKRRRLRLSFIPIQRDGHLRLGWLRPNLSRRTKLVAVTHTSNALGAQTPLSQIIRAAHRVGARVLVDAAQAVSHQRVNVEKLGCDWLAFSGHKMYGPMGIGVLWGRRELLEDCPPWLFGGEMISEVSWRHTTFADTPAKFEAGTQNAAGIIGLSAAVQFLQSVGYAKIRQHEQQLTGYALRRLKEISGITMYGPATVKNRGPVVSFNVSDVHAHDVAQILDGHGISVRAGHHCAMPLMSRLGVPATVRASFGIYNTMEDIERLVQSIKKVQKVFNINVKLKTQKSKCKMTMQNVKMCGRSF